MPPLNGYLLSGLFYSHREEELSTVIPVIENSPGTKAYVDPQLGHSALDRPDIAWIAADGAFSLGLGDRFSPEIPKAPEPTDELRSTPVCFNSGDVVLRLRYGKGSGETVLEPWCDPDVFHHLAARSARCRVKIKEAAQVDSCVMPHRSLFAKQET